MSMVANYTGFMIRKACNSRFGLGQRGFTNTASVIAEVSFTALSIEHSVAFEYQLEENYLSVNVSIAYTALSLGTSLLVVVSECW